MSYTADYIAEATRRFRDVVGDRVGALLRLVEAPVGAHVRPQPAGDLAREVLRRFRRNLQLLDVALHHDPHRLLHQEGETAGAAVPVTMGGEVGVLVAAADRGMQAEGVATFRGSAHEGTRAIVARGCRPDKAA